MSLIDGIKNLLTFDKEELVTEVEEIKKEVAQEQKKASEKEAIQKIIDSPRIYFKSLESFNKYYNTYFRVLLKATRGEYDITDDELKELRVQFAFLKVAGNFTDFLEDYMDGAIDETGKDKYGIFTKKANDKIYWN